MDRMRKGIKILKTVFLHVDTLYFCYEFSMEEMKVFKIINKTRTNHKYNKNLSPHFRSFESFVTNINNDLRLLRQIIASLVNLVGYWQRLEQITVVFF